MFAETCNAVEATFEELVWGWLNFRFWDLKHVGSGINNQAGQPAVMLEHKDAVAFGGRNLFLAEAFSQVQNRDNFAAEIDDALHVVGSVGHSGDLGHSHDLMKRGNWHTVGFTSYAEADDVKVTIHASLRTTSGRQ